ncbi:transposase [Frankia tisae]|uniref:transposase n=1 Tax=Frankia tisae TaxID=2950104 RepID=UPI0021C01632|nr:transposase [Frankia tisae]
MADRWQTVFVDSSGGHGLLGQVEGRTASATAAWITAQPAQWRANVWAVTTDMSTVYTSAVRTALPHAIDPFHIVQLANKAVGDVRRRVIFERYGRRGHADDPEYKIRGLLVRNVESLSRAARGRMLWALADTGDGGRRLTAVHKARELLRAVLAPVPAHTGRPTSRAGIGNALTRFFTSCATVGVTVPEVVTFAETISAWRHEIANAVLRGLSNATAEGVNRLIKLVYRVAFGLTNVTNQQRRARYAASRHTRPIWLHIVTTGQAHPVIV